MKAICVPILRLLVVVFCVQSFFGSSESNDQSGVESHCTVISTGKSANITCYFGEDIRNTNRDFSIMRYDLHDEGNAVPVLTCTWLDISLLKCHPREGYTYSDVSTQIVLGIPNVTKEMSGRYRCQGAFASAHEASPCYLELPEKLEPPNDVQQINSTYESVTISWRDHNNASTGRSYRLRYMRQEDNDSDAQATHATHTRVIIAGLEPGTTYEVFVAALNTLGESSVESSGTLASTRSLPAVPDCPDRSCIVLVALCVPLAVTILAMAVVIVLIYRGTVKRLSLMYAENRRTRGEVSRTEAIPRGFPEFMMQFICVPATSPAADLAEHLDILTTS